MKLCDVDLMVTQCQMYWGQMIAHIIIMYMIPKVFIIHFGYNIICL